MLAILSWLSILFINYIQRDLDSTKILFFRFLVVKLASINAASENRSTGLFLQNATAITALRRSRRNGLNKTN